MDKSDGMRDTSGPLRPQGRRTGEVSERLKELVSKTSSGLVLLVGSNPTLSASSAARLPSASARRLLGSRLDS